MARARRCRPVGPPAADDQVIIVQDLFGVHEPSEPSPRILRPRLGIICAGLLVRGDELAPRFLYGDAEAVQGGRRRRGYCTGDCQEDGEGEQVSGESGHGVFPQCEKYA